MGQVMVQLKSVLDLTQRVTFYLSFKRKMFFGKKSAHLILLRDLFHDHCLYISQLHKLWIIVFIPSEKGQQAI